jgi:hypothetical protein
VGQAVSPALIATAKRSLRDILQGLLCDHGRDPNSALVILLEALNNAGFSRERNVHDVPPLVPQKLWSTRSPCHSHSVMELLCQERDSPISPLATAAGKTRANYNGSASPEDQ